MVNPVNNDTDPSAAVTLGKYIRSARKLKGWTISEFAEKLGRAREWLNRIELGYSEFGEYKPADRTEAEILADLLGDKLSIGKGKFIALADVVMADYIEVGLKKEKVKRNKFGKLTQTEIIIGEKKIVDAIVDLIEGQATDAIIRNTSIKNLGNYERVTDNWQKYRDSMGQFLKDNPDALFKRVEYAATEQQLSYAKSDDKKISSERPIEELHNVKIKFQSKNPLNLHTIIGKNEAIIALPQTSGQSGSNIALLIKDKVFVEALRIWYDEVMWDMPGDSTLVDFEKYEDSFDKIKKMYGY